VFLESASLLFWVGSGAQRRIRFMKKRVLCTGAMIFASLLGQAAQLDVPYYWQANADWCWAASASMLANYYDPQGTRVVQCKPWYAAALLHKAKTGTEAGGTISDTLAVFAATTKSNRMVFYLYSPT
jgi:hypothetical protein